LILISLKEMVIKVFVIFVITNKIFHKMDNQKFYDYLEKNHNISKYEYSKIKNISDSDKDIYELFNIYISLLKKEKIEIKDIIKQFQ